MSENDETRRSAEDDVLKLKDIQFIVIEEERNQKILTFNRLTSFSDSNQLIDFQNSCLPLIFLIDINWAEPVWLFQG